MRAIVNACRDGLLDAQPKAVISNNADSPALVWAGEHGLRTFHLSSRTHPLPEELDAAIAGALRAAKVEMVLLSGYMKMVGPRTLAAFPGRILNVHPALLPKFGGAGMYGTRVHDAVLAAGETDSGVTIHLVNEEYDRGPIVAQSLVPVQSGDDAESLAARVLVEEHKLYVASLRAIAAGEIDLDTLR